MTKRTARFPFHSFTFKGQLYAGHVTNVTAGKGVMKFSYTYDSHGVTVAGSFVGGDSAGLVEGSWAERSSTPIDGESRWAGTARLHVSASEGECHLSGTWSMKGIGDERWLIELPR